MLRVKNQRLQAEMYQVGKLCSEREKATKSKKI